MDAPINITVLGPTTIHHQGQQIPPFRTAKAHALLLYLLEERATAHTREHLMALLWPGLPEKSARDNLRQTLYLLRKSLPVPLIGSTRQTVRIDPAAPLLLDLAQLAEHQREIEHHNDDNRLADAVRLLSQPFADNFSPLNP